MLKIMTTGNFEAPFCFLLIFSVTVEKSSVILIPLTLYVVIFFLSKTSSKIFYLWVLKFLNGMFHIVCLHSLCMAISGPFLMG